MVKRQYQPSTVLMWSMITVAMIGLATSIYVGQSQLDTAILLAMIAAVWCGVMDCREALARLERADRSERAASGRGEVFGKED